ncbi:hypothetical protein QBC33DRAFT_603689 [Phialemonium atrogriseum]|uniref:Uncharacterized protein n=1 Tax=Phialemonium atrogriseum TaxID=1093897 RepID=A0AAJ0BTQ7_9PEZI|nr:uncharacterized protein QBC33DRAFT_603689 [Phialemonium atrogriseum]KAK1761871.1 hypothetical protein QBC33DRAFT_603689 [Phialemonium atrogriseum]
MELERPEIQVILVAREAETEKAAPAAPAAAVAEEAVAHGVHHVKRRAKIKMYESVIKQCIKHLESKGYITDMKSVEHPNKKMYIRADLRRRPGALWQRTRHACSLRAADAKTN